MIMKMLLKSTKKTNINSYTSIIIYVIIVISNKMLIVYNYKML